MSAEDISKLKDMGFPEDRVRSALKQFPNTTEAIEYLLSNDLPPEVAKNVPIERENIIEFEGKDYPHMINWTGHKSIQITGNMLNEVSFSDYYYYWGSVRASVKVGRGGEKSLSTGTWYYEVTITGKGNVRMGWCIPTFNPGASNDTKVGDGSDSWGVDGTKLKKYHQGKEEPFGSTAWTKNDIIGTMVDFDSNKIFYSVNGSELQCAFTNVTADQLIPCFSLQSRTKFLVNFGPHFSHKPRGAMGLNSSLSEQNLSQLEKAFDLYAVDGIIQGANTLKFLKDMGATGATHPVVGVVAWKMNAGKLLTITREEWLCTWALTQCYTMEGMRQTVGDWLQEITDKRCFTNYYNFLFKYLKLAAASLPPASAIRGWMLAGIDQKWELWPIWKEYVEKKNEAITLTTWNQLLNFINEIGSDPTKYDPNDGAWPLYLEEFAEAKLVKK
jgi:hypothetical protein